MINMDNEMNILSDDEIDVVSGGALLFLGAVAAAAVAVGAVALAAKALIEVGEKLHDATCKHPG